MVEEHVTIIHWRVAILRADVTHCDSRQRLVGLHVANLYDERLRPVVDIFVGVLWLGNKQLCDDNRMVGGATK